MNGIYFGQTELAVFKIISSKGALKMNLAKINLNVAWTDFRTIPDSSIYVKRMRPLIFTSDGEYGINGHVRYHHGQSENPRIGTIEDWFMINPMGKNHPIHIHLIQYQTVELIALKKKTYSYTVNGKTEKVECSYYWMDFLKVQAFSDMNKGISN